MFLRWRPGCLSDVDECLAKMRDWVAYGYVEREKLRCLWSALLRDRSANFTVVEDNSRPSPDRIVWFCFTVFVVEPTVELISRTSRPYVSRTLLGLIEQGLSPVLRPPEIAASNATLGVNLLVAGHGTCDDMVRDQLGRSFSASRCVEWIPYATFGYNLKRIFVEYHGNFEWRLAQGLGLKLLNDYRLPLAEQESCSGAPGLFSLSRYEAECSPGTILSAAFHHQSPRFNFSANEQELLLCALNGDTDDVIAFQLCLSRPAIRKRWDSIFERITAIDSCFLGAAPSCDLPAVSNKRRLVVGYIRQHLEELRPYGKLSIIRSRGAKNVSVSDNPTLA
jgi:hypothetical protein